MVDRRQERLALERNRVRGADASDGNVIAYNSEGEGPLDLHGTEEGPFMVPYGIYADKQGASPYNLNLNGTAGRVSQTTFSTGEIVDVTEWRVFNAFFRYTPDNSSGRLILILEGSPEPTHDDWYPLVVVDGSVSQVNPPGSEFENVLGVRTIYPAGFRTPVLTAVDIVTFYIPFDVSPVLFVRIRATDSGTAASQLTAKYVLSR